MAANSTNQRKHLARRWSSAAGLTLRCTCGQWETRTGTTREKEDAHRAHRVAMGETVEPRKPTVLEQLRAENERLQRELNEIVPRAWCQCCVFGNHTERCTCAAATCCHPERHAATAPDSDVVTRPEEWIEWGYYFEYPDGTRDMSPLASAPWPSKRAEHERERAHGMFRAIAHDAPETRYVLVSRRVTYTPWTDEEA